MNWMDSSSLNLYSELMEHSGSINLKRRKGMGKKEEMDHSNLITISSSPGSGKMPRFLKHSHNC